MTKENIVVIGGGAAGLTVASGLLEANYRVTLLEASKRLGGRIQALDGESNFPIELGASLIDDKKEILYQRAKTLNMLKPGRGKAYFIVGEKLRSAFGVLFYLGLKDLFRVNKIFKLFYQWSDVDAPLTSLLKKAGTSDKFNQLFSTIVSSTVGTPIENVGIKSLSYSMQKAGIRPERDLAGLRVSKSFTGLLSPEVKRIKEHVHFNTVVNSIDYNSKGIKICCDNDKTYYADLVVITVPLAILKQGVIEFSPPLPAEKQKAISMLGMGRGIKTVMFFKQAFWRKRCDYIMDCDNNIMYFVHSQLKQHVLIAYSTEPTLCEKTDDEVIESVIHPLDIIFAGSARKHFDHAVVKNWYREPFIGGSYSHDPPGSEGCREKLAETVRGKLFFAGEACINGHASTVDGAILSGKRVIHEILNLSSESVPE